MKNKNVLSRSDAVFFPPLLFTSRSRTDFLFCLLQKLFNRHCIARRYQVFFHVNNKVYNVFLKVTLTQNQHATEKNHSKSETVKNASSNCNILIKRRELAQCNLAKCLWTFFLSQALC